MNIFRPFVWLKKAALVTFDTVSVAWYARNGYRNLYNLLGSGGPTWSGESVSAETALNHSVVWACNRIISESVAFLPLAMMQERNGNKLTVPLDNPVQRAIRYEPNTDMTDMEWRETSTSHTVMQGNGYSQIFRRSGTDEAREFYPLLPGQVVPDHDKSQRLVYVVKDGNSQERTYTVEPGKPHDILHIRGLGYDGIQGYSVVHMARQSFATAQSAEKYAAKFYAAGGRVPYLIEMGNKFRTDEDFRKWREDWNKFYGNPENFHLAPVLEPGMTYRQTGLNPEDAQFLETRQFAIPEICRWFLLSPHLVGDLSRATFSNIEQLALSFAKQTLTAWLVRWEKALWRCVLTEDQKSAGYYFKHNLNGLLRGDFVSRMSGYASALQNGHLSINEVRDLEDLNPVEGGDNHFIQLNLQSIPGQPPTASQAAAVARVRVNDNGTQRSKA